MKKIFKFLPLMLIAMIGIVAVSCSDDDKDEIISFEQLPTPAKTFISQYFPGVNVVSTQKDKNEYEVFLSDGTRIDFDYSGEWTDVDAATGKTIPNGFYPAQIDIYIGLNLDGAGINEISKEANGYEVGLVDGRDLLFNAQGEFVGYDR